MCIRLSVWFRRASACGCEEKLREVRHTAQPEWCRCCRRVGAQKGFAAKAVRLSLPVFYGRSSASRRVFSQPRVNPECVPSVDYYLPQCCYLPKRYFHTPRTGCDPLCAESCYVSTSPTLDPRYGSRRCHDHGVVARQRDGRRVLVTWRALFAGGWGELAASSNSPSPLSHDAHDARPSPADLALSTSTVRWLSRASPSATLAEGECSRAASVARAPSIST